MTRTRFFNFKKSGQKFCLLEGTVMYGRMNECEEVSYLFLKRSSLLWKTNQDISF